MLERIIFAGFGGQGLMFIGKLLAQVGMEQGLNVTYFPSYGAEVRGGTANCNVVLSSGEISSPVVEEADALVVMNQPSFTKFVPRLKQDGLLLVNSTMVDAGGDQRAVSVPASQTASDLGDVRVANLVMLGAYNQLRKMAAPEMLLAGLEQALSGKRAHMLEINTSAFNAGVSAVLQ